MMDLFCLGELLVDMMPIRDGNGQEVYQMHVGGAAGNVAVAVSQLGSKSCVLSKIGQDVVGHKILRELEQRRVSTAGVCVDPVRRSTLVLVSLNDKKVPEYLFYRENAASLSYRYSDVPEGLLQQGRALYLSSIFLTDPQLRLVNYEIVDTARHHGLTIFYDVNMRLSLWKSEEEAREQFVTMIGKTNILKVNDEELEFLFGTGDYDASAREALKKYPQIEMIVLTLGSKGARLYTQSGLSVISPAYPADVINTSGAGDSFFGSMIHWYLQEGLPKDEASLKKIGRFANAAAYLTSCKPGAMQALPTLGEVTALLSN